MELIDKVESSSVVETRGAMVVTDSQILVTEEITVALAGVLDALDANQPVYIKPGFTHLLKEDARHILAYDAVKNITKEGIVDMPLLPESCGAFTRPQANTGLAVCTLINGRGNQNDC